MVSTRRLAQLLAFIIGAGASVLGKDAELTQRVLSLCSGQKPIFRSTDKRTLQWLLDAAGEGSLLLQTSPQHLAACWILYTDRKSKGRSKPKLLQRFALATLHYGTTRSNTTSWDWKMAVDVKGAAAKKGHWMSVNRHECGWYGVVCDAWSSVIGLEMGWMALDGLIPRELGLLTTLREINFSACDLQGVLPHKMLAALSNLQYLRLHMNGFFGSLHREVAGLKSLKELVAFGNYLGTSRLVQLKLQRNFCRLICPCSAGSIPTVLGDLGHLEVLDLYANQLTGTVPTEIGRLKHLRILDLHDNNIVSYQRCSAVVFLPCVTTCRMV